MDPRDGVTAIQNDTDLNNLPVGLYFLTNPEDRRSYLPVSDEWMDGESYEFVRVRPVGALDLPEGLPVEIRPDGCAIVRQWVCVEPRITARVRV